MITKGLIKTIDYNNNSCTVRLPLFEGANTVHEVILPAIFSVQPGVYNGYAEGDVVFVDFETDNFSTPIVIGKLFLGMGKEENSNKKSNLTASTLTVTNSASLPLTTTLTFDTPTSTRVPVDNRYAKYKSLLDIINALNKTDDNFSEIKRIDYEAIAEVKTAYLSQESSTDTPALDDSRWSPIMPAAEEGKNIWQKTTFHNMRGQILKYEIICLANLATVTSYWLRCSTPIHVGKNQTEDLVIVPYKKVGLSKEAVDTDAYICYKWINETGAKFTAWQKVTIEGVRIASKDVKASDLLIQATHDDEGDERTIYEEETITYSPLNTPVVDLSNDTDDLSYNADGTTKIDSTEVATSTARLYLNGKEVTANITYEWEIPEGVTATNKSTKTITISGISNQSVSIPCTITVGKNGIDGKFIGESYTKTFTVTKKLKGDKGDSGFNTISLHIENDRDSVPCASDGTPASGYAWATQTKHTITAFDGVTPITFTTVTKTIPTTDSKDYTLVYKDEGVGYKPGTTSNILNYEASVESLSTDTGKVIYKLYKGKTLLDSVSFVITKNKAGASTIKLSISNDFASIVCDSDGNPVAGTDWSITEHTLKVLDGITEKEFSLVKTKTDTGYEVVYNYDSGKLTAEIENKTITLTNLIKKVGSITYDLYKNGMLLDTAKFEATKIIPGTKGEAAISYYILATAYQIKKSKNETDKTPDKITFTAYSKTGTDDPEPIFGYWTYAIDDDSITNGSSNSSTQEITTANITKELKVNFYLDENRTKLVDRETLPVVADGDDLSDHYVQANIDTIKYDPKAAQSYSPTQVTFKFYSQVGLNEPTRLTLSNAYYTITVDGGSEGAKTTVPNDIKEAGITVTAGTEFKQSYTITLYDSKEEFLDSETVSIIADGTGAMSCVVESSAGTSFKKPFNDRATTLTAHLYEGTVELDTKREWFYEWYWFNNTESDSNGTGTVIERSTENSDTDANGNFINSYKITLKLADLENKSVYFIAYPDGRPAEGTDVAILNVARLGLMSLGKN